MDDPTKIPKGKSPEVTPPGRTRNLKGVYLHKETGKRHVALSVPAADALALQGHVYEGPVPAKQASTREAERTAAENSAPAPTSDPEKETLQKKLADAEAAQKVAEEKAKSETEARAKAEADAKTAADAAQKAKADAEAAQKALAEASKSAPAGQKSNSTEGAK